LRTDLPSSPLWSLEVNFLALPTSLHRRIPQTVPVSSPFPRVESGRLPVIPFSLRREEFPITRNVVPGGERFLYRFSGPIALFMLVFPTLILSFFLFFPPPRPEKNPLLKFRSLPLGCFLLRSCISEPLGLPFPHPALVQIFSFPDSSSSLRAPARRLMGSVLKFHPFPTLLPLLGQSQYVLLSLFTLWREFLSLSPSPIKKFQPSVTRLCSVRGSFLLFPLFLRWERFQSFLLLPPPLVEFDLCRSPRCFLDSSC